MAFVLGMFIAAVLLWQIAKSIFLVIVGLLMLAALCKIAQGFLKLMLWQEKQRLNRVARQTRVRIRVKRGPIDLGQLRDRGDGVYIGSRWNGG